jgi:hypothetical protein
MSNNNPRRRLENFVSSTETGYSGLDARPHRAAGQDKQ